MASSTGRKQYEEVLQNFEGSSLFISHGLKGKEAELNHMKIVMVTLEIIVDETTHAKFLQYE